MKFPRLTSMTLDALVALRKKIDNLVVKRVAKERKRISGLLSDLSAFGGDVGDRRTPVGRKGKRAKAKIKYRGPKGEKWSGRGMTPLWMRPLLKQGKKKESFLVKKP